MIAAAIDLGTNSIKILIVRRDSDGHMHVLLRHRSVVRLGEGSYTSKGPGKIPRHVQLRTLKAFQTYARFLEVYKVDVVRAIGTSALRDAKNGPEFVKEVRDKTGIALEVLPGNEEARLIAKGVASEIKVSRAPTLFIDIGGGSCEISLLRKRKIERFVSLPLGAVRMTEQFLGRAKPDPAELRRLDSHIGKLLRDKWPNPAKIKVAYGSAGTIRALARLISKTELADDDRLIGRKQLERASDKISRLPPKRIAALPGVDSKRSEILVGGTRVLRAVFSHFGIDKLHVSNRGLREGLLIDLFEKPQKPAGPALSQEEQGMMEFLISFGRRYQSNRTHCQQVWNISRLLFEELAPVHGLSEGAKPLLLAAAMVHDVGKYVSLTSSHKHSFYILKNSLFPFFTPQQVLLMAVIARYHRKSPPKESHEGYKDLSTNEKALVTGLASLLRLADALDAAHDQGVRWLKCQWGPGKVSIQVDLKSGASLDQEAIRDKGRLFEELYKVSLSVVSLADSKTLKSPPLVPMLKEKSG